MNVLSLFDGISCARVALEDANIRVDNYFASEIDDAAIFISKKNWPDIIHLGDINKINAYNTPVEIDLLIGGSPCQDLSICKAGRKGLEGERSGLFYKYVEIKDIIKPKYFILENVAGLHVKDKNIITDILGVEPIMLDAQIVSAQRRKRLFWTNIPNIQPLIEQDLYLRDVLETVGIDITERVMQKDPMSRSFLNTFRNLRSPSDKANTLTASGQNISNAGSTNVIMPDGSYRKLTPIESERLQGLADNYTQGVADSIRYKVVGNGFHVKVVSHILSHIL